MAVRHRGATLWRMSSTLLTIVALAALWILGSVAVVLGALHLHRSERPGH